MKQSNTFPFRLHEMLDTVTKEGSEHVVSWIPGNDIAFKVHKPAIFVETIMPRFFQQTKYKVRSDRVDIESVILFPKQKG
jgi:hypothetical protein